MVQNTLIRIPIYSKADYLRNSNGNFCSKRVLKGKMGSK